MATLAGTGNEPDRDPSPGTRLRRLTTAGLGLGDGDIEQIILDSRNFHVDNPFRRWDEEVVEDISRLFARSYNLWDKERLFVKAGQVLHNPTRWEGLSDQLERDEKRTLAREQGSFWQQPKMLQVTIVVLCFCAMTQGWTQTVSNVANLNWPTQLGLESFARCDPPGPSMVDTVIFAIVNASTYFAASMIGCWFSDPLSELFLGRRTPIFISAILILASTIGAANCHTWETLLVCRIILGMGMGCKATVTPVFAAEVAPNHLRGTLVVNWQLFNALGIALGFATNLAVSRTGEAAWRWQTATLCAPTAVILLLTYICPDSPRFQMKKSSQQRKQTMHNTWQGETGIKTWFLSWSRPFFCMADADEGSKQKDIYGKDHERVGRAPRANNEVTVNGHTRTVATRNRSGSAHTGTTLPTHSRPRSREVSEAADYRKAFQTFEQLRGSPLLAAKELLYVHVQMIVEKAGTFPEEIRDKTSAPARDRLAVWLLSPTDKTFTYPQKIRHLWTVPRIRRATGNAVVCMIAQQLCGVNVLAFYSSTVFSTTICEDGNVVNSDDLTPLWLSFGIGALFFVLAILAYWTIERPGRRASLLGTIPFMAVFMLGASLCYLIPEGDPRHTPAIGSFAFLFIAAYSPGMGPVPFTVSSEVFPLEHRMVGMSISVFSNLFGAGVLALIVPPVAQKQQGAGNIGLLGLFAVLNLVAFVFVLLFVRETASTADEHATENGSGRAISLEELQYIFQRSTKEFLSFQKRKVPPFALECLKWPGKRIWSGWIKGKEVGRPIRPRITDPDWQVEYNIELAAVQHGS